ncbi:hypothetical protein K8352_18670 [Flavobacteriaceae bacterium F89]|uniref:Uncharacterized protein n=1 Tax=Cerina litoralis TaxID=2874477 RepID=A0AAE3JRD3_9FLAO|nr:hypothetical protein [Cerina litoralis]MCG2462794.1 hypothetical protein [Cerina litoralis]
MSLSGVLYAISSIFEPPYTRPAWFILSVTEEYGGLRGALSYLMADPSLD